MKQFDIDTKSFSIYLISLKVLLVFVPTWVEIYKCSHTISRCFAPKYTSIFKNFAKKYETRTCFYVVTFLSAFSREISLSKCDTILCTR